MYKDYLHRPTDTELRLDIQLLEDQLDVTSILAAREQAKLEVSSEIRSLLRILSVHFSNKQRCNFS